MSYIVQLQSNVTNAEDVFGPVSEQRDIRHLL